MNAQTRRIPLRPGFMANFPLFPRKWKTPEPSTHVPCIDGSGVILERGYFPQGLGAKLPPRHHFR